MRRLLALSAVTALCLTGVTACGGDDQEAAPRGQASATPSLPPGVPEDPQVWVQAEQEADPARQLGSADVSVDVASVDGGRVQVVESDEPGIGGDALRYPAFTSDATYPRAVVTVHDQSSDGSLDPGDDDFSWGADFKLDETSTDRVDDNGNNMVQRGISSYPALFKLEVDSDDRPACTVRGTEGTLIVRSDEAVLPGGWYRARCTRTGDRLEVAVAEVLADGSAVFRRTTNQGPMGSVVQDDPSVPLSIGGKVGADGRIIASASDQFNGELADPYLSIDR